MMQRNNLSPEIIHPTKQQLINCRKWMANGSQSLVDGVNIGDNLIFDGQVYTCAKIEWREDRYFYGVDTTGSWDEQSELMWIAARHVKPYTLLDVLFDIE
jgi:hypothetical protein